MKTVHRTLTGYTGNQRRTPEQAVRDRLREKTMTPQAARSFLEAAGLTEQCIEDIMRNVNEGSPLCNR